VAEPLLVVSCTPPGRQAVLLHVPSKKVPRYVVIDRTGVERARSDALGVAASVARFLVVEQGEAWVRASDDTTAHLGPGGLVETDTPACPWIRTLTTCLEESS
jgi:hypothetical protein